MVTARNSNQLDNKHVRTFLQFFFHIWPLKYGPKLNYKYTLMTELNCNEVKWSMTSIYPSD